MPFYRTQTVRIACLIFGAGLTFAFSPAGPTQWRDTPSLLWLHKLLPWPLMFAGLLIYVVALALGQVVTDAFAYLLGLGMYGCAFVALIHIDLRPDQSLNPFAIAGIGLACILHFAAAKLALTQLARK